MGESATALLGLIAAASVLLAVLMSFIAFRAVSHGRGSPVWRSKAAELDRKLARSDSLFRTYPGLAVVWDRRDSPPRLLGSTAALASLRRFADKSATGDAAAKLLAGLDAFDVVGPGGASRLSDLTQTLLNSGKAFSVSLILPSGAALDATGRVAGAQAVLWIDDPALRTETDESDAIRRLNANRSTALRDPLAFIDLLDRTTFPVWRLDSSGSIRWANSAYVQSVGASTLAEVIDRQLHLDAESTVQAKLAGEQRKRVTATRPVVVLGQRRALQISLYPVSGGTAGVAVDASEADALRNALVTHIRAHDETLNALTEGVVVFGSDTAMRFHNTAFSSIFGLDETFYERGPTHSEWLDRARELRTIPEQADYAAFRARELSLYTDWPEEMPDELWSLPDGRTLRVVRQRDPEGGLLLLFADMTTEVKMKGQLGNQIAVQKATFDRLSEAIAVFGSDGQLRLSNRAFATLWGLSEAELSKQPMFTALIPQLTRLHRDEGFWRDLLARMTDPDPDVRRLVSGSVELADQRYLTWLSRPLPDGATLVVFEDRTEARAADKERALKTEALEAANRIKSDFVGHISYQLRNPLTTISGFAELLATEIKGELNDDQAEYVFAVQTAAGQLTKMIDDILDIAAIEANQFNLELGDVDMHDLLDTTLDYIATRAEDTKIQTRLVCPRDIGVIRADAARLRQVVYNILLNALRFTKPGGHIELGAAREDGGIRFWVRDDGVGIPPEEQTAIFDSFSSSRAGGAGLGLALVENIIDRHGGWVELKSRPGEGTHVVCYLPAAAHLSDAHPELALAELGVNAPVEFAGSGDFAGSTLDGLELVGLDVSDERMDDILKPIAFG